MSIMKYKETALCPICGLPLEKQGRILLSGVPMIKAVCPNCGHIAYFFDWKTDSKMEKAAAEHLHDDLSEARDVTVDGVKEIESDVTSPANKSQYQSNCKTEPLKADKTGKVFANFKFYPRFCRKLCRFFCHLTKRCREVSE